MTLPRSACSLVESAVRAAALAKAPRRSLAVVAAAAISSVLRAGTEVERQPAVNGAEPAEDPAALAAGRPAAAGPGTDERATRLRLRRARRRALKRQNKKEKVKKDTEMEVDEDNDERGVEEELPGPGGGRSCTGTSSDRACWLFSYLDDFTFAADPTCACGHSWGVRLCGWAGRCPGGGPRARRAGGS